MISRFQKNVYRNKRMTSARHNSICSIFFKELSTFSTGFSTCKKALVFNDYYESQSVLDKFGYKEESLFIHGIGFHNANYYSNPCYHFVA